MHPILESLKGTPNAWLVDLLFAFNRGDIDMFERLKPSWAQQVSLIYFLNLLDLISTNIFKLKG